MTLYLSGHPWIERREPFLLRVTFPAHAEDEELVAFTQAIRKIYRTSNHVHAWVLDCSQVRRVSAKQRGILAQHEKEIEPFALRYNAGWPSSLRVRSCAASSPPSLGSHRSSIRTTCSRTQPVQRRGATDSLGELRRKPTDLTKAP